MSIFGDIHQLSDGLELVNKLTKATERLVAICTELNDNVEKLTAAIEKQTNQKVKTKM